MYLSQIKFYRDWKDIQYQHIQAITIFILLNKEKAHANCPMKISSYMFELIPIPSSWCRTMFSKKIDNV